MKRFLQMVCCMMAATQITNAQDWTWMHGLDQINAAPSYGTLGVAHVNNNPGGRHQAVTWTDAQGNLWLFGGQGIDSSSLGLLNDIWKYNVTSNQWTWMKGDYTVNEQGIYGTQGIPGATNKPGARRGAIGWTDTNGNLWLFGGRGFDNAGTEGHLDDIWKYNTATNQWTYVQGSMLADQIGMYGTAGVSSPNVHPAGRMLPNMWKDTNGDIWIFGGQGYPSIGTATWLSELWKLNTTSMQWTWMGGDSLGCGNTYYGTLGVPSSGVRPCARISSTGWVDANNNLWMFGGYVCQNNMVGQINDVWKYNTTTNLWTWMDGDSITGQPTVYGAKGITAPTNQPGGRRDMIWWKDNSDNFWMLGGYGISQSGSPFYLNDLWKFNSTTLQWTWMEGDSVTAQYGVYGTMGVGAPANQPGSRVNGASWVTPNNDLWLMGGMGRGTVSSYGYLNDLWKYNLSYLSNLEISQNEKTFSLFPNPTCNNACLYSANIKPGMYAHVYNGMGQLLFSKEITSDKTIISTENMNSGIYLVHVVLANRSVQQLTLVKQ